MSAVIATVWRLARRNGTKQRAIRPQDAAAGDITLGAWQDWFKNELADEIAKRVVAKMQESKREQP